MEQRPIDFAHLTWPAVEALLAEERPVVLLLPLGATEPHGPHAPLATDGLISIGLCRRVAVRLQDDPEMRALVLPALDYGVTRYSRAFPGAIHVGEETLQALIVDVCRSLIGAGFRHLMLVNNHFEPEQVATIHRSLDRIEDETGVRVGYLDLTRRERAARLTEEFQRSECHAGRYETSLVLAERPALVRPELMRDLPALPISLVGAIQQGQSEFKAMGLGQAYNGAPAEATAQEGEATFERLSDMLVGLMRQLVGGTGGRDRPGRLSHPC